MSNVHLVRLLHGNVKNLSLNGKHLDDVPKPICRMDTLVTLELKNNHLKDLPNFMSVLSKLEVLHLGNNCFPALPAVLEHLKSLQKLHLYSNHISHLQPEILLNLTNLTTLNLNNNLLTHLPPEIGKLVSLEMLTLDGNKLQHFPAELCMLPCLKELRAARNNLHTLPLEIGGLSSIRKIYLSQNNIRELPEGFGRLQNLQVLDVSGNELRIFPTETHKIPLSELYCEANPLLEQLPVHSVQEEEVLSLKEITARLVMKEVRNRNSIIRRMIFYFPGVREMLAQASRCAVCSEAFLNTWLECVKFVQAKEELRIRKCQNTVIPVRALLCSYKCFNSAGHAFFGVAFP